MLSLTSAKSGALIGVLISVTTIPAAANIGVAVAFADWTEWRGAMAQLVVNLCGDRHRRRRHPLDPAPHLIRRAAPTANSTGRLMAAGELAMACRRAPLAARHRARRRARRGQLRRRPRRRPGLLRRRPGLGPAALVGLRPAPAASEQLRRAARSSRRRHLEVLGADRVDQDPPPAASTSIASSVAHGSGRRRLDRLAQRLGPEHLRRLRRPQLPRSNVPSTTIPFRLLG